MRLRDWKNLDVAQYLEFNLEVVFRVAINAEYYCEFFSLKAGYLDAVRVFCGKKGPPYLFGLIFPQGVSFVIPFC